MSIPPVSVIMPVHNAAPFLDEAIGSVLGQTYRDFELIAVDDGSTDGNGKILRRYAEADSRIVVLGHANRGLAPTLNRGIRECRGELVAVLT